MHIQSKAKLALLVLWVLPLAAYADFKPALARMALDRDRVQPGGTLQATYTFRSSGPSPVELSVFVHVVRPDGRHLGADFSPDLPTAEWPTEGFVREGPFPIAIPPDAAPGKYQIWVGLYSIASGERIELDNADRQRGSHEYHVGEFEVLAAGTTVAPKPAVFDWLPVDETKVATAPPMAAQPGAKTLDRVTLAVDKKVLNPVREKNSTGKLTLTAFYSDGSQRTLRPSEAAIKARTKAASGNVDVVTIEGDKVMPKEGGIATVEAVVKQAGRRLTATTDVVVAPFYRDYHQTLVLKLFLGMEGEPVERLAKEPLFQKPHDVICTFKEALEVIRKTDNLTRGIPKIVYLVGWQKGGHDHGYPAWDEVNPRMKRKQDANALESLRWLIREARKFNTTVSLHINMVDAYKQSPLWDEYVKKDCFARESDGQLRVGGIQMKGEDMYNVVYPREWEAGLAQRRIDGLIKMIPELKEGHTIHVDVFVAQREGGSPISPWHAKPENGGLTPDKYVETQRKIFHYWRDRGFDVTGEGIFWAHPPGEGFTGLQAMSWWYPSDLGYQMQIPECLMARGRTDRGGDGDFRFTSSMHGEEIYIQDKENMPGFLGMFCRTTLPWYYLSRLERQKFENNVLYYSDGVVARSEDGKNIIRKGEFVLRENDNLFVPALWNKKEIIAYSRPGYENKSWQLPEDWRDVKSVDLYRITLEGCVPLKKRVAVTDSKLVLSLGKDEAVSIAPTGAKPLDASPEWAMGPFVKLDKPVLSPNPEAKFPCPLAGTTVLWEGQNVYNPAVVVKDGKVYLLYRADDKCWWKFNNEDQATSRIGLAWSEDGRRFTRHPTPVVFPDKDAFTKYEWPGGCQDVHVVEGEDSTYYMNYTAWGEGGMDSMCVATSKDLIHWQKHGPAFAKFAPGAVRGSRSGVVLTRQLGEKLLPVKINGQYLMYYTHPCVLAVSDNLIDWKPLGKSVWPGGQHESGAIALWRDDGILLMFNGQNLWNLSLPKGTWALGQALIDREDLVTARRTMGQPFLQPEFDWEKKGYCSVPATVANGMVCFKGEWLLYYGAADRHIGLAVYRP